MDKELHRFINGEANYYKGETIITREKIGDSTYYEIRIDGKLLTQFWGKLGKVPKSDNADDTLPPKKKSTGGKKPYVMLMTNKLNELMKNGKTNVGLNGYLMSLVPNIEWNTGRLINKHKKTPLNESDICKIFSISEKTWKRKSRQLQENNLMTVTKDGYFISTELFKKGKTKD